MSLVLMLLDSAGLYYRAFHGVPTSVRSPRGEPVNAVRGFLDMVASLVNQRSPGGLVACWDDDWRPQWRVDLLPSYKAHRLSPDGSEESPADLGYQVDVIAEVLACIGIPRVGAPDFEADDVIATLARREGRVDKPVEIVTGDRDLLQVISDDQQITVDFTGRGVARLQFFDAAQVEADYGVRPDQYADFALLRGDPSDGLPGVAGIGAKTAASLLQTFGSAHELMVAAGLGDGRIRPRIAESLRRSSDYVARAWQVVRVAEVDLPEVDSAIPTNLADPDRLQALITRWDIGRPVNSLLAALALDGDRSRN